MNVPAYIATLSKTYNFLLIHISTDYVFDGKNPPYNVDDKPNPLNFYGDQKNIQNVIDSIYYLDHFF